MKDKELELINLAKQGNDTAFETLLANYKNLVVSISRKYFLIGGNTDDLLQEGMIAIYKAVKSYDVQKNVAFSSYAKVLIERQIINAIKKDSNQKNNALNTSLAIDGQGAIINEGNDNFDAYQVLESKNGTPESMILGEDGVKETLKKISRLLSEYEMQVLIHYLNGLTYTQIADEMKKTPKSIDNAINRIKTKLNFLNTKLDQ